MLEAVSRQHGGRVVAQKVGKSLRYRAKEKGAYREEAYRRYLFKRRGRVFSNPISIYERSGLANN